MVVNNLAKVQIVAEAMILERRNTVIEERVDERLLLTRLVASEVGVDELDSFAETEWGHGKATGQFGGLHEVDICADLEFGNLVIFGHLAEFSMQEERTLMKLFPSREIVAFVQEPKKGSDDFNGGDLDAGLIRDVDSFLEGVIEKGTGVADDGERKMADAAHSGVREHDDQVGVVARKGREEVEMDVGHCGAWEGGMAHERLSWYVQKEWRRAWMGEEVQKNKSITPQAVEDEQRRSAGRAVCRGQKATWKP